MKDPIWELLSESKVKMKIKSFVFCLFLLLNSEIFAQTPEQDIFFMFYNVENLFDTKDDPETSDEEFTPGGARRWTYRRFKKKLLNTSKVILNASGWTPPHLIVVCEVENRYVLDRLLKDTPLNSYPYKIIHKQSPDTRGIDVALLYNSAVFYPLEYAYYPLRNNTGTILDSREIMYVSGTVNETDTLHIFGNHWPSRYSGLLESQPHRYTAARTLRICIEEVQKSHVNPKIIIAGDFNDQPTSESMLLDLNAKEPRGNYNVDSLYNLSLLWIKDDIKTLKYQLQWSVFDQIIVTGSLLQTNHSMFTRPEWAQIVKLPFLLEKDERYGGMKLNRTYVGYRYHGGFSDHLPVLLKIRTSR